METRQQQNWVQLVLLIFQILATMGAAASIYRATMLNATPKGTLTVQK